MKIPDFSKYRLISFDIFDTLITRLMSHPHDVFSLVEMRAAHLGKAVPDFAQLRIDAELSASAKKQKEVTLDDIYVELARMLHNDVEIEMLKELELQAERDVCVALPAGKKLWNAALQSSKPIVVISDMYLPSTFLGDLLEHCGYKGWSKLFVSNEYDTTKASGSLFDTVVSRTNTNPHDILHIGDNPKSDILQARKKHLHAFRMPRPKKTQPKNLSESFVYSAQSIYSPNKTQADNFDIYRFGYTAFGPILVGFCEWLAKQLDRNSIQKVYYLARDGLIIQKTMETLGRTDLMGTYLYASRRALEVPSFALLDTFSEILHSMNVPRKITLLTLFEKMGLDKDLIIRKLNSIHIDPMKEYPKSKLESNQTALKAYKELKPYIREKTSRQLSLLEMYLRQVGFSGKLAIVDIGWYGNMQVSLERICKHMNLDCDIYGFYVGLSPHGTNQSDHKMSAYLFDTYQRKDLAQQERNYNLIFETLFSALHGTTKGYQIRGQEVEPILDQYTGIESKIGHIAEQARQGALQFATDWARVFKSLDMEISPDVALSALNKVGLSPTLQEAEFFGNWAMEDDGDYLYAAKPKTKSYYARHFNSLLNDFSHTTWKIGFLKRLFKIPFPYDKIWMRIQAIYANASKRHTSSR